MNARDEHIMKLANVATRLFIAGAVISALMSFSLFTENSPGFNTCVTAMTAFLDLTFTAMAFSDSYHMSRGAGKRYAVKCTLHNFSVAAFFSAMLDGIISMACPIPLWPAIWSGILGAILEIVGGCL